MRSQHQLRHSRMSHGQHTAGQPSIASPSICIDSQDQGATVGSGQKDQGSGIGIGGSPVALC